MKVGYGFPIRDKGNAFFFGGGGREGKTKTQYLTKV